MINKEHNVTKSTPFVTYIRLLVNMIIEYNGYQNEDIAQLTREHECAKISNSTEKQLVARCRSYLNQLYSKAIIEWSTAATFLKILRVSHIRLSLTIYTPQHKQTFVVKSFTEEKEIQHEFTYDLSDSSIEGHSQSNDGNNLL